MNPSVISAVAALGGAVIGGLTSIVASCTARSALVEVGTGIWELRQGTATIAIGRAVTLDLSRLERATYAEAVEAEKHTPIKPHEHLLPMCFVCGPDRAPGDGLGLFAGPLVRQHASGAFAVPWTPAASLAAADGLVAPEFVWSVLDCPTGYVSQYAPETGNFNALPILLGCLSVRIEGRPRPGERCVVTSWKTGSEGRRLIAEAALFGEEENLLAVGLIAAVGGDENSAKDQRAIFANLQRVKNATGVHVALIGHTGKDESRGARGSRAFADRSESKGIERSRWRGIEACCESVS
jgi:hypothetical protein